MTRPVADLELTRGDDVTRTFAWRDANGDPIPLTGRTFRAQIRTQPQAGTAYPFVVDVDEAAGVVTLTMAKTVTAAIPSGRAWWDIEQTVGGQTTTPFGGRVTVYPDVTR
jgi:hypothetical protein